MDLTEKQQQWLEDLVFEGSIHTTVPILDGKIVLHLTNLTGEKQLAAEKTMGNMEGTPLFMLHSYSLTSLAQVLEKYETKKGVATFPTSEESLKFIKSRPTAIIDAMMKAHSELENELKKITIGEVLTENFSKTPGTEKDLSSI